MAGISQVLGWVLVASGLAAIVGWFLQFPGLLQGLATFPPLTLPSAVGVLAIGVSMVGLATNSRRSAGISGLAVFLPGVVTLVQQATGHSTVSPGKTLLGLAVGPLPVSSALLLAFGGAGILALALPAPADRGRLAGGALGAIVVVLGLGTLVTRNLWQPDAQTDLLVGTALPLLLGALVLGGCLVLIAWSADPLASASAPWVPLSVGIACLVTVLFLWRTLVGYQEAQIHAQTAVAASSAIRELSRQIDAASRALSRISRFSPRPAPRSNDWENNLVALTRDVDGLRAVAWTDESAVVHELRPAAIDNDSLRLSLQRSLSEALRNGERGSWHNVSYFVVGSDGKTFAAAVPICEPAGCAGYVLGLFDSERALAPVLSDSSHGFLFQAENQRRVVLAPSGTRVPPPQWVELATLQLGTLRWDLKVWPTDQTLGRLRSGLPDLVLLLGLLGTALLPVTIRLAQVNWSRAQQAERVRLNLALETSTDGLWEWDITTGATLRSAALWRHLGYDPDAMPLERDAWNSLIHPEDQRQVQAAMSNHLAGLSQTFEAEYRVKDQTGDWHWVIDRGRVVERSAAGGPLRVLGISGDITERKRADQALEGSERRFRACFDSAYQVQALLDRDGTILEVNRAALDFANSSPGLLRGRPIWEASWWRGPDGSPERIRAALAEALKGKTLRRELQLLNEAGEPVFLDFSLSPLVDKSGAVVQLLVEARDVTVHKRAEDALREVESLTTMGRLAARVAHEINNPLAGIQNAFLLIKDSVPADHPHRSYVGAIEREIARIAAVTRQLYETYRPEHGDSGEASVSSVVGDAVALLEQVNRTTGVRIVADLARAPAVVPLPDAILRQAIYNLVQNAVEASPPGGVVDLIADVEGGMLVLRVCDRGPGIPAEIRERVFEPFFTTKSAAVKTGGMGLGLSLVRRSVHALGGRMEIVDRPGGGTEFVVRLPVGPKIAGGSL